MKRHPQNEIGESHHVEEKEMPIKDLCVWQGLNIWMLQYYTYHMKFWLVESSFRFF